MRAKKLFAAMAGSLLLILSSNSPAAFAEVALPEGAVKGLPERLAALDDQGNAVNSATGEYFFHVEDMEYGVEYTKIVQLMNLREDAAYNIYFYVEPLFKAGEIDLEEGCTCTFWLDDQEIYHGSVTGVPDNGYGSLQGESNFFNCGAYYPGDSHKLKCSVIWDDLDVLKNVDNGHKLVDKDGTHVLVGPNDSGYVEGEIEFKWIFYASILPVDGGDKTVTTTAVSTDVENYMVTTSSTAVEVTNVTTKPPTGLFRTPFTGYLAEKGTFWLVSMGVIGAMILILLIMIHKKKRKQDESSKP